MLERAFGSLNPHSAPGVDRVTWQTYKANLETHLAALHEKLVNETYCPQPVVRRLILKSNGKLRPRGLPALEDKIVAKAVAMLLEAIYEQDFCDVSYGFRPGRSPHHALHAVRQGGLTNGMGSGSDCDSSACCDNLQHDTLLMILRKRIKDGRVLELIEMWLHAGILDGKEMVFPDKGSPQGSVLTLPTKVPTWCESFRRVFHEPNCAPAMGMGFLGPPGRADSPWRTRHHGSKETSVARRAHRGSTTLEVRITFAPSRVSPACVAQAYERVGPSTRHPMPQGLSTRQAECAPETQRVGRRSVSCIPPR